MDIIVLTIEREKVNKHEWDSEYDGWKRMND